MELRNINTFLHIAELHSFSRTARQLGYSQSAVSSQIATAGSRAGRTAVRPRGQDRAASPMRARPFRLCTHPAGHGPSRAQAALQPARPDQRQSAHRAGAIRCAPPSCPVCSNATTPCARRWSWCCAPPLPTGCCRCWAQIRSIWPIRWTSPCCSPIWCLAADDAGAGVFYCTVGHPLAGQEVVTLEELPRQEFLLTERGMSYRDALDQCLAARGLCHPPLSGAGQRLRCCARWWSRAWVFPSCRSTSCVRRWPQVDLPGLNVPDCTVEMHSSAVLSPVTNG